MCAKLALLHQFDHQFDQVQGAADCIPRLSLSRLNKRTVIRSNEFSLGLFQNIPNVAFVGLTVHLTVICVEAKNSNF